LFTHDLIGQPVANPDQGREHAFRDHALESIHAMSAADRELTHLSPAASRLGAAFARPKVLAAICVVALAGLGWLYLALLIAGMAGPAHALGPGMGLLDYLPRAIEVLCSPSFGLAPFAMPHGGWGAGGFTIVALMWGAMTLAMMLPSASPLIFTYAEIADTAARKGERIVSPFMLAAGYTLVWFGFAAAATLAQFVFSRAALLDAGMASASGLFSGAIFIGAGAYQFSALKHACLTQCQHPFPFFFAHWATTPRGVFRLGVKQGLYCLGCCWAMMLVMFAVGVMNVIWMAGLGALMTMEKIGTGRRLTHMVGTASIAIGVAFVLSALAAHWPVRAI
jgi:predicted metal-binding membrane protein